MIYYIITHFLPFFNSKSACNKNLILETIPSLPLNENIIRGCSDWTIFILPGIFFKRPIACSAVSAPSAKVTSMLFGFWESIVIPKSLAAAFILETSIKSRTALGGFP